MKINIAPVVDLDHYRECKKVRYMPNILPGPFDECVGKFHAAGAIYPQDKNAPTHECAVCEIEVVEIFHPSMLEAGWYG